MATPLKAWETKHMLTIKNLEAGYGKVLVLHGISIDVPKARW